MTEMQARNEISKIYHTAFKNFKFYRKALQTLLGLPVANLVEGVDISYYALMRACLKSLKIDHTPESNYNMGMELSQGSESSFSTTSEHSQSIISSRIDALTSYIYSM